MFFVRFLFAFFLSFWQSKEHTDIGLRTGMTCWILENLDECCMKERMAECWRTSELGLVIRCGSGDDDLVFAVNLLHFSHPVDWHVGGRYVLVSSQAPWIFYHLQDWKKNPQDWHIILYQSPTKSSMDYFMIFETQKNPQDLQLLVAQVLSAFHMCNIILACFCHEKWWNIVKWLTLTCRVLSKHYEWLKGNRSTVPFVSSRSGICSDNFVYIWVVLLIAILAILALLFCVLYLPTLFAIFMCSCIM